MAARRVIRAERSVLKKPKTGRLKRVVSTPLPKAKGKQVLTAEQIRELRRQLSPDSEKPLSQQRFSQLLNVSWSTVARWEAGGSVDSRHALKLARLQRALAALGDMVTPEYRLPFFEQPHPLLMKLRPIDLLETDEGAEAVIRQLEAAATGAFA
jgi:DNA-binding transcriptional regulator YiaG